MKIKQELIPQNTPLKQAKVLEGKTSTIEEILQGKSKIKFLSESMEEREVNFRKYQGTTYSYELEVDHLTKPTEKWVTELSVWFPAAYYPLFNERLDKKPEMQIDILTGQGCMRLSSKQEVLNKVYKEIVRQTGKIVTPQATGKNIVDTECPLC